MHVIKNISTIEKCILMTDPGKLSMNSKNNIRYFRINKVTKETNEDNKGSQLNASIKSPKGMRSDTTGMIIKFEIQKYEGN
jgi:hypothetical protein